MLVELGGYHHRGQKKKIKKKNRNMKGLKIQEKRNGVSGIESKLKPPQRRSVNAPSMMVDANIRLASTWLV